MTATSNRSAGPVRVAVTGVGAVTALGTSTEALWAGVKAGRVAIRSVQQMPMDQYMTLLGGEVQEMALALPKHDYRRPEGCREPEIDFALKAAEEALEAAGIGLDQVPAERWGVVVGTCSAGLLSGELWYACEMSGESPGPRALLLVPPQALAEALSGAFGLKGPVLSINTACAAGANAVGYAAELIRSGQADAVLTGGSDAFSDALFAGFTSLEALSPGPATPFSRSRRGLSIGEGSGMLVLVREDLARRAGAPILAEVLGYGLSADGYHPTAPHPEGEGASRAIAAALAAAGVSPAEIDYVNAHGTGTAKNDAAEAKGIYRALGASRGRIRISSTKSMIGHLMGAAGAVEAIVTVKALQEQLAPPTANFDAPDPACDFDFVPNVARPLEMNVAISNNFAFGGANASLVLARPGARRAPPPRPEPERVVVTGLATLTCAGCDPDEVWEAFASGRVCTNRELGARIGRVEPDPSPFLTPRDRRRMDRLGVFAVVASGLALRDAELALTDENRTRVGVMFGTAIGPMESMEAFVRPLLEAGPQAANPAVFPSTVYNAAAGHVALHLGAVGPTSTLTAGHAAGASAICYGYDLVAGGQADAMICVAADTLTETVVRAYRQIGLLRARPDESDFGLSEAGVALVLERLASARARGARIYGEILGYGIAADARGIARFDPRGSGLERAMRLALERAGRPAHDVDEVWASAVGQRHADRAEVAAVRRLFGGRPRLVAPKLLLGEPFGAGGPLNAVLALKSWQKPAHRGQACRLAVVNSCSLGGTHFSITLAPYAERDARSPDIGAAGDGA